MCDLSSTGPPCGRPTHRPTRLTRCGYAVPESSFRQYRNLTPPLPSRGRRGGRPRRGACPRDRSRSPDHDHAADPGPCSTSRTCRRPSRASGRQSRERATRCRRAPAVRALCSARRRIGCPTKRKLGPLLQRMPAGLGQTIGETGWRLSQGERARVCCLARALLADHDVLILDEPLGALDPQTARSPGRRKPPGTNARRHLPGVTLTQSRVMNSVNCSALRHSTISISSA